MLYFIGSAAFLFLLYYMYQSFRLKLMSLSPTTEVILTNYSLWATLGNLVAGAIPFIMLVEGLEPAELTPDKDLHQLFYMGPIMVIMSATLSLMLLYNGNWFLAYVPRIFGVVAGVILFIFFYLVQPFNLDLEPNMSWAMSGLDYNPQAGTFRPGFWDEILVYVTSVSTWVFFWILILTATMLIFNRKGLLIAMLHASCIMSIFILVALVTNDTRLLAGFEKWLLGQTVSTV